MVIFLILTLFNLSIEKQRPPPSMTDGNGLTSLACRVFYPSEPAAARRAAERRAAPRTPRARMAATF